MAALHQYDVIDAADSRCLLIIHHVVLFSVFNVSELEAQSWISVTFCGVVATGNLTLQVCSFKVVLDYFCLY